MRTIRLIRKKHGYGQGLVEFALIMPLLLLMLMGIIDFSRIFYIYSASSNASREAVRVGATDPNNCATIDQAARSQLAFIPPSAYIVKITYDDGTSIKYTSCQPSQTFSPGDRILVDVQADFSPLTPIISRMFPTLSLHYASARTIAYTGSMVPPPPPMPPVATTPAAAPTSATPTTPTVTPPTAPASATSPGSTPPPTIPTTPPPVTPPAATPEPTTPEPAPVVPVNPILECTIERNNNAFTAYFGYKNDNSGTVYIPVGSANNFDPNPQNRGQPTTFQPGRTAYWPNAPFNLDFNGNPIAWILTAGGQTKTASASRDSSPCSQHVFIEEEWYDADANKLSRPPAGLPISYTITAQTTLGVAVCSYPTITSTLTCTYTNRKTGSRPALDDDGLWAPIGTTYVVTETGLPQGWTGYVGLGTFTSDIGGYCLNGRGGYVKNCTHVIKNTPSTLVVTFAEGYPYREFGSGSRDIYARVYVTFAGKPVDGATITFTRTGSTFTATTDVNGYACTTLGKSQQSGETVDVTANKAGYQSGVTSSVTASIGTGGCP